MKENNLNTIGTNSQQQIASSSLPKTYMQYISQGNTINEHLENIKKVCKAGGKWVQLRLKNVEILQGENRSCGNEN